MWLSTSWSGRPAVLISVPVAVQCLVCPGLPDLRRSGDRTLTIRLFLLWSLCFKMLILTRDDSPKWALPLAGGLVLTGVTALWVTGGLSFLIA